MKVTIWHNVERDWKDRPVGLVDGYGPAHLLVAVATYEATGDPLSERDRAFHVFNVGDDPAMGVPDERAVAYRARGNRSLSKGDVVQIDDEWFACASFGWDKVKAPSESRRVEGAVFGSTPMDGQLWVEWNDHVWPEPVPVVVKSGARFVGTAQELAAILTTQKDTSVREVEPARVYVMTDGWERTFRPA